MNKFVIPSCVAILVLFVLLYAFKPDYFEQSSKFGNVNKMMLLGPDGEVILTNVSDIDEAINAVGAGVEADTKSVYQTKADMAPYATTAAMTTARTLNNGVLGKLIEAVSGAAVQKSGKYVLNMTEPGKNGKQVRIAAGNQDNWNQKPLAWNVGNAGAQAVTFSLSDK